ncbi:DUF4333 domain-containing protein [Mycobacteroides franklinii]|uniref:DUF4333 domain-containing protein n=2 Tax=Mycobacteroides franklinii TaxID=948102 RepID=A0A4R5P9M0_9MYCO|nr:DUF4333 domain-containing protein [Mycobacteroides franklinii]TDH20609.1 DUF4333 domain-containing protein [Mycobacteroides franklinii]
MAATLILAALIASGCSVTSTWHAGTITPETTANSSVGTPPISSVRQVPKEQAAKIAAQRLDAQFGGKVDSVICDGPLDATVGATQRCVMSEAGQKAGLTLTVTKVEGDKVDFRVKVDDQPLPE